MGSDAPQYLQTASFKDYESCLAAFNEMNRMEVFTLFDSGNSTGAVSPDLTQVSDTRIHSMVKLFPSQLGTVAGCDLINYGVRTPTEFGGRGEDKYCLDTLKINNFCAA